ncbi:substrate-binding periplasmic protein [Zooshikella ganghwensis]|uniref:Solute-binding protein family 3/N-terminal domain-containing protein n=1 Tax=Zooshikella ganghwensis TaxID=202772 RepID=A0A4P9VNQ4_9GAMM|nr:transporter substrate-binding domain-containing protein [Zooshikella ganghwensis]RDH43750.1 hypothetical protein B9G39_10010 [Zooshikella ganghwensis]
MKLIQQAIIMLTLSTLIQVSHADTITIRADKWFPINGEPKDEKPGYMIEIANAIMSEHGHQIDYKMMPWQRSLLEVKQGNYDCLVGVSKSEAPDFIYPTESWGKVGSTFYVKKGNTWTFKGIDSLENQRLGVIGGYDYSDDLDAYIENKQSSPMVKVISSNNALEKNLRKLVAGRITVTVGADLVVKSKLNELGLSNDVVEAGLLLEPEDIYIACSPAKNVSQNYVQLFSDGIKKLRETGKLKTILDKYGLDDWL